MNHNWVKDEFLMNGSALMGVLGLHNFVTLTKLLLITSLWWSVYWRGHSSAKPSVMILPSCRPCSSHIPWCCWCCCYASHGRWSDERNMASVCIFAGFQVTYNCFFFPISFFNCMYLTSHYYDALLGSHISFWGFYFYYCRFLGNVLRMNMRFFFIMGKLE